MNEFSKAVIQLIQKERFHAELIASMKLHFTDKIATAGVNVQNGKVNLYVNMDFFRSLDLDQRVELLKHEAEHIIFQHPLRFLEMKASKPSDQKRANIAGDAVINEHLPAISRMQGAVTIDRLNEQMKAIDPKFPALPKDRPMEYYYEAIKQFVQKNKDKLPDDENGEGMGDSIDDHSIWGEGEQNKEMLKEAIKGHVNNAVRNVGIGNVPGHLMSEVNALNASTVNWRQELRRFFINTHKFNKEATRKKRNRRYGIVYSGKKKEPNLHIGIAVDTSGSVSDQALQQFFSEIDKISEIGVKITVMEADSVIQNVYEYDKKKKPKPKGRGGTAYQPAFDKAKELKVDGIIYFGDMDCADTPQKPNIPVLWAIVGSQNPPVQWGSECRVTVNNEL